MKTWPSGSSGVADLGARADQLLVAGPRGQLSLVLTARCGDEGEQALRAGGRRRSRPAAETWAPSLVLKSSRPEKTSAIDPARAEDPVRVDVGLGDDQADRHDQQHHPGEGDRQLRCPVEPEERGRPHQAPRARSRRG